MLISCPLRHPGIDLNMGVLFAGFLVVPGHPDGMAKIRELVSLWFEAGDPLGILVKTRWWTNSRGTIFLGQALEGVFKKSSRNTSWDIHITFRISMDI